MSPALEHESREAAAARRRRRLRRSLIELSFAGAFLLFVSAAARVEEPGSIGFVALAATVLLFWFVAYWKWLLRLDEFERRLETDSIALAGGATILLAAAWGLFEFILGAPHFPMMMLAPLFAAVYGVVRILIAARYR